MTEIVTHRKQYTKLFEDPEKINKNVQSPVTSRLCTDSFTLSKVDENQSEFESIVTPNIQILKSDGELSDDNMRENEHNSGDFRKIGNIYKNERKISNQSSTGHLLLPPPSKPTLN